MIDGVEGSQVSCHPFALPFIAGSLCFEYRQHGWVAVDHIGSKGVVEEVFEVVGDHLADYVSIDPYVPLALERMEHKVQLEALQERHESIASSDGDSTRVETPVR